MQISTADNVDLAWLQEHLLRDQRLSAALVDAGVPAEDASKLLQLRAHDKTIQADVRVNLTGSECFWLNDIENDAPYKCATLRCPDNGCLACHDTCNCSSARVLSC